MGDRRPSLFSRFLGSTAPPTRRAPTAQTPARPRARTTATTPSPSLANAPSTIQPTTTATPPNVEPKTPIRRPAATTTSDTSIPSVSPKPNGLTVNQSLENDIDAKAPPPSNEPQKVDRTTDTTSTRPVEEPTKVLPSNATTQSRSSPLPSSPSRATPQARSTPPSPSRVGTVTTPSTPPKASLRSPSNVASRSPKTTSSPATIAPQTKSSSRVSLTKSRSLKETESSSLSKEPQRLNQETTSSNREPTFSSNTKEPKPVEPLEHLLTEVDGKNKPHIEQKRNLDVKKEVQELVQLKNGKTSEPDENKKAHDFLSHKSGHEEQTIEKAEIPRIRNYTPINDYMAPETKEISSTSLLNKNPINAKTHDTPNKRTTNSDPREHFSLHNIKNGLSKFSNQMSIADLKSDNNPSVITLAGENRGAVMQIGSKTSQGEWPIHIHRGYKLNSEIPTTHIDHGSIDRNKFDDAKGTESDQPPEAAYVNNNSQGLNNSIVLSSSVSERDPGVHIVITKETIRPRDGTGLVETRKVEYNTSSANKLAYSNPVVKRKCLRGMLLDSSDSDPEKPRRHGCRVEVKGGL